MKRFLWFNIEKLRVDIEYFLVVYILLIFLQVAFYYPINKQMEISHWVFGGITSILFIYISFMKKEFCSKDVLKLFLFSKNDNS